MNSLDRCDECGAQAFMQVTFKTGELLFCAHHGNKHLPLLKKKALSIIDDSAKINKAASTAAY